MSEDDLLTTAEAARIARVGGSSVKRWADQRLLPCVRTAGGHRRFRRADLERFLASLTDRDSGSAESWAELCLHATMHEVWGEIVAARGRAGAYYPVMAELGLGLVELGRRWERGEVTILDEHAASEKLARALERTADGMSYDPTSPTAVLAVAERDEHTLGLSLAEVVLREAGWNVRWAGRQTPVRSTEAHRLAAQLRTLVPVCKQHGVKLVLGGSGAWPEAPEYGVVMRDFAALHAFAENLRRDLAGG
jgi:excisionase family DNA binding protein